MKEGFGPKTTREAPVHRAPWYSNLSMVGMALLSLGQAPVPVSAAELAEAKDGPGACTQMCDADGSQVGQACFIPRKDGRGGGELYVNGDVLARLHDRLAGKDVRPELLLPKWEKREWCRIEVGPEVIDDVINAYLGARGIPPSPEEERLLPPVDSRSDEWVRPDAARK